MYVIKVCLFPLILLLCIRSKNCFYPLYSEVNPCPVCFQDMSVPVTEAQRCAQAAFFMGSRESYIPEKERQVDKYCRIQFDEIKCLEMYACCTETDYNRRAKFTSSVNALRANLNNRCYTTPSIKEFYRSIRCIDRKSAKQLAVCLDRFVWTLVHIKRISSKEEQFAGICCSMTLFKDCIRSVFRTECEYASSNVKSMSRDYVQKSVSTQVMAILDIDCKRYEAPGSCRNQSLQTSEWFNYQKIKPQKVSVIFTIIDIICNHFEVASNDV